MNDEKEKKHKYIDFSPAYEKDIEVEETDDDEELEERVLDFSQRRKRAQNMRRFRSKIKIARERAKRRRASPEKLKKRARRKALGIIKKRLMKAKNYSDMSPAEKIALDKRVQRMNPNMIDRIARRQLPIVRQAETQRLANVSKSKKNESLDESFELFMEEIDVTTPKKRRFHRLLTKEGQVVHDMRFKRYRRAKNMHESVSSNDAQELMESTENFVSLLDKDDPENRLYGTDSLVDILRADTPGEKNESYFSADIGNSYGLIKRGDRVSFDTHSMGSVGHGEGTVVGSDVRSLRIRDDYGKLFKVRHSHARKLDESLNERFERHLEERISIPKTANLGIQRRNMPQISSPDIPDFLSHLKTWDITSKSETISPKKLKATQNQFSVAKVEGMLERLLKGDLKDKEIMVSRDNYIMDGHHRWLAHLNAEKDVKIRRIDLKAKELLDAMHDYPKSFTKKLHEDYDLILTEDGDVCPVITRAHMEAFAKVVDKLFDKFGIDFNFTKHFRERMSDGRNDPCISLKELGMMFKKIYLKKTKGADIFAKHKDTEVVLKDMQSDLNMPVAIEYDRKTGDIDVVAKTIMRKKNFRTPNKEIKI